MFVFFDFELVVAKKTQPFVSEFGVLIEVAAIPNIILICFELIVLLFYFGVVVLEF